MISTCYNSFTDESRGKTKACQSAGLSRFYHGLMDEDSSRDDIDEALKYAAESHRKAKGRKRQIIGEFIDELLDAKLEAANR